MKFMLLTSVVFLLLCLPTGAQAQNLYYLPHVANGDFGSIRFRTTFILFNNTNADVVAILNLTDNNGKPLTATIVGFGTDSQFTIRLDAGSTGFLQTDGLGSGAVGAATVTAPGAIGVSAIFTLYDPAGNYLTEAGVESSDPATELVFPVDVTGPFDTGLALYNPGSGSAAISAILVGLDGTAAARTTVNLNAGGHLAIFAAGPGQLFPDLANFQGTLVVQSPVPLAALVLRQYSTPTQIAYTSMPAVPRTSSKLTLNLAQVANGAYGNIGYKTSFLVFNISSTAANVSLALTKDDGSPFTVTIPGSGPGTGTNSSFSFTLAAGASIFLQTDGSGAGTSGAATITSNVPVGASAIFTVVNSQGQFQTEAGVGDSPVLASLTLPVDITGSFDTGVAFYNPGSSSLSLTLKLLDTNGVFLFSQTRTLASKNHLATFVDNLFPGVTNFRGSLAVLATGATAATTLRQYASGATFTTLPTASGVAAGKTPIAVLQSKTVTGITALAGDPDVAWNDKLLPGAYIYGTITGAGQGLQVQAVDGAGNAFAVQVNPLNGKYLLVVPAGTYNLTAFYRPAPSPNALGVIVTYSDPNPIQVTVGFEIRDIALPPVTLFNVSGSVSGLSRLPPAANSAILFTSSDNKMQGQATLDASGNYQSVLPAGNYVASVIADSLQLYNLGLLTVSGSPVVANYAIPPTAKLSGIISSTDLSSIPFAIIVTATDASAPAITQHACCNPAATTGTTSDPSGQYQMILAQNRNYGVGVTVPFSFGAINYPLSSSTVGLGSDTILDFAVPKFPARAIIFGKITDSSGNGIANVIINAYSRSITDAANMGFSGGTQTDIYGNYSLVVLSGTSYQLSFVPPTPKP